MMSSDRLTHVLAAFLRDRRCTAPDVARVLVAVSGGADSTALLRLALDALPEHGCAVVAGHVNHAIRPDADVEEERLRTLCAAWRVPFVAVRLAWTPGGRTPSEADLRRERFRTLRRVAVAQGCARVLLGHHLEDNVETLLFRLSRGSGLQGLAGIPEARGMFLRPLLDERRASLRAYLAARGIPWVEDPTNADLRHARNRIRHLLLPLLEIEIRAGSTAAIARSLRNLRAAASRERHRAEGLLVEASAPAPAGEIALNAAVLRTEPDWVIPVLSSAVQEIGMDLLNTNTTFWTDMARAVLRGRSGLFFSPGVEAEVTGRVVRLRARSAPDSSPGLPPPATIPWNGMTLWGHGRILARRVRLPAHPVRLKLQGISRMQVFDADAVTPPLRVRPPAPGDRIDGDDSSGTHRLNDLLSEAGVPRADRGEQPLIEDRAGVLWAPGIRRAQRALVRESTKRIWILRWTGRLPVDRAMSGGVSKA